MKFEEKSFSSRPASDEYRANWEVTFSKKPAVRVLTSKLCPFTLYGPKKHQLDSNLTIIGMHVQRCVLLEGHEGNHQWETHE